MYTVEKAKQQGIGALVITIITLVAKFFGWF
jgi:hypothetical protein